MQLPFAMGDNNIWLCHHEPQCGKLGLLFKLLQIPYYSGKIMCTTLKSKVLVVVKCTCICFHLVYFNETLKLMWQLPLVQMLFASSTDFSFQILVFWNLFDFE